MNASAIAGTALAAALLAQTLKKNNPEWAGALTIGAGILFFMMVLHGLTPVLIEAEQLLLRSGANEEMIQILLKCLGTCLLVQFSADCCRDAGESALAGRVEFAGKAAVVTLSLPLFQQILSLALSLLG